MFEVLPGLRNREFTPDQEELVMAIKDTSDGSLFETFQDYWKKRCDNQFGLSDYDAWEVIDGYAREIFGRAEWYHMREYEKREFREGRSISSRAMAEMYLSTIHLMQVRYEA